MAFCIYPSHSETRLYLMMSVMLPWRYNISTSRKNDPCQYRKIQRPTSHLRSQYYYCGVLDAFGVTKDCQFSEFRHFKVHTIFLSWWTYHLMIINIMPCVSQIWVRGSCQLSINQNKLQKKHYWMKIKSHGCVRKFFLQDHKQSQTKFTKSICILDFASVYIAAN